MVMTLILDTWETLSLTAGCNLYSKKFKFCALNVRKADQGYQLVKRKFQSLLANASTSSIGIITASTNTASGGGSDSGNMFFRERDKPLVDADTFLATALPKILMASLIIFLNALAIVTLIRSNRWMTSIGSSTRNKSFFFLPQSTQGLLHSLFFAYFILGLLTLYSQLSLSAFILGEYRFVEDQGMECLTVNCSLIAISVAISLHLVSLAVDRTLASYLNYAKYTDMAKGTVPLWLLAIWLPSGILGALPLAGWRNNFSFCIFLHQFNDDYLKFVSGFFFANICIMPCLYFYFISFLKPAVPDSRTLYRWHRKLQSHHKLTFAMILGINTVCWSPFHVYLLLCCLTCAFPSFGTGFLLEYLFIIALVPSIIIPMMFTIRSSALDQCAAKISRFVHFRDDGKPGEGFTYDTNPLSRYSISSKKSPLFYIDEFPSSSASSTYRDTLASKKGSFFVPRYLPMDGQNQQTTNSNSTRNNKFIKNTKNSRYNINQANRGLTPSTVTTLAAGTRPKTNSRQNSEDKETSMTHFSVYLNKGYNSNERDEPVYENGEALRASSASTQETDSQCGFPISPHEARQIPPVPSRNLANVSVIEIEEDPYYSRIITGGENIHSLRRDRY